MTEVLETPVVKTAENENVPPTPVKTMEEDRQPAPFIKVTSSKPDSKPFIIELTDDGTVDLNIAQKFIAKAESTVIPDKYTVTVVLELENGFIVSKTLSRNKDTFDPETLTNLCYNMALVDVEQMLEFVWLCSKAE